MRRTSDRLLLTDEARVLFDGQPVDPSQPLLFYTGESHILSVEPRHESRPWPLIGRAVTLEAPTGDAQGGLAVYSTPEAGRPHDLTDEGMTWSLGCRGSVGDDFTLLLRVEGAEGDLTLKARQVQPSTV